MSNLNFKFEWDAYPDTCKEVGETSARLAIYLGNYCLTKNEDVWSRTLRDSVYVSLYPLALWFASSWWRLNHEVLPNVRNCLPSHDWRMGHEIAAANMGFVWPEIVFSADGSDTIQIWAQASRDRTKESVRFINGLEGVHYIPKQQFQQDVSHLIGTVISRLEEVGCRETDLAMLWKLILEDQGNPGEYQKRRIEAALGFDPECCPDDMLGDAIRLEDEIGESSFSELTGAHAGSQENRIDKIRELLEADGLVAAPDSSLKVALDGSCRSPWEGAVAAARSLRSKINGKMEAVDNNTLFGLFGISEEKIAECSHHRNRNASIAGPESNKTLKLVPRKTHPLSRRFEIARFLADYIASGSNPEDAWLVSSDLSTARQKFQRAFAAELLCPIDSLVEYLGHDFSETAVEDAATHFDVSEKTVESLLMNNNFIPRRRHEFEMPYSPPVYD